MGFAATRLILRLLHLVRRNRRLAKDFENLAETPATFVTLAPRPACSKAGCQGVGLWYPSTAGRQRIKRMSANWIANVPSPERPVMTGLRRFPDLPVLTRNGEVRH